MAQPGTRTARTADSGRKVRWPQNLHSRWLIRADSTIAAKRATVKEASKGFCDREKHHLNAEEVCQSRFLKKIQEGYQKFSESECPPFRGSIEICQLDFFATDRVVNSDDVHKKKLSIPLSVAFKLQSLLITQKDDQRRLTAGLKKCRSVIEAKRLLTNARTAGVTPNTVALIRL